MATREVDIKVTIRSGSYQADLKKMERSTGQSGKRMGEALKRHLSKGLDAAKASLSDFGNELKGHLRTAATLGGAVSLGGAIKEAMTAQTAYLQLSDALTTFGNKNVTAAETQEMVERVAKNTKLPIEELRMSLMQLAAASGKVDIEALLERAGSQARRLGMQGEFISRVYTRLVAKGISQSAEEAENLTEQFNTLFRRMLGVDLDEAIDPMDVAELAGFINTTGNSAEEMLKIISLGGEKISKDFGKANEIVEEMGELLKQTKGIDEMTKKLKLPKGIIDSNRSALENMLAIAERGPKKFQKMTKAFGRVAAPALEEIFGKDLLERAARAKGKEARVAKKEWDLRIEELRGQLSDLGDLAVDRQKIEAADLRHKKTITADFDDAMNTLMASFADKDMQKAISDLAKNLPALASGIASVTEFIVESPIKAAGIGIAARTATAGLGGFASSLVENKIQGGKARDSLGKLSDAGNKFNTKLGKMGGAVKLAVDNLGLLAGAFSAGAAIGTGVYEKYIAPEMEETTKRIQAPLMGPALGGGGLTIAQREAEIKKIRAAGKSLEEGTAFEDVMDWIMENSLIAQSVAGEGGVITYRQQREDMMAQLARKELYQREQIERQKADLAAKGMTEFTDAASKAAEKLKDVADKMSGAKESVPGTTGSARGTRHLKSIPGAEPVSG